MKNNTIPVFLLAILITSLACEVKKDADKNLINPEYDNGIPDSCNHSLNWRDIASR